jgi:uncharacterized protein YecA (UPF0149 family)
MTMMSDNSNDQNKTASQEDAGQKPHVHGPNCNHGHHHGHHHHDLTPYVRSAPKVGPNEPCPCGSGKKHKKCCRA